MKITTGLEKKKNKTKQKNSFFASEKSLIFEDNKIGENNNFAEKDFFHWMIRQTKQVETGGLNIGWHAW